jgi:hypothetical protein
MNNALKNVDLEGDSIILKPESTLEAIGGKINRSEIATLSDS